MNGTVTDQISRLSKDSGIIAALVALRRSWGEWSFDIVDHWEANLHGVGLAQRSDRSVIAYIDNFRQPEGFYYLELEGPAEASSDQPYRSMGIYDSVSFEDLKPLVARHLALEITSP